MPTIQRWSRPILLILLILVLAACGQSTAAPATADSPNATTSPSTVNAPVALTTDGVPTALALPMSSPAEAATTMREPLPTPSTAPSATPSSASVPASGSAIDAMMGAYQAAAAAKSYRIQSTITTAKTPVVTTYEIVRPDRLHVTTVINGRNSERILIGSTMYTRTNGSAWVKTADTTGIGDVMKQLSVDAAVIAKLTKNISEAKLIGPDTLDGKLMTVYQYKLATHVSDAGAQSSSIIKLWIGSDNRPYKLESDGGSTISGATRTSHSVSLYSGYDSDIKIEAPIP